MGKGRWFRGGVVRKIGDGMGTRFWKDEWVGFGVKLLDVFPRLFSVEVEKNCCVGERLVRSIESTVFRGSWNEFYLFGGKN